MKERICEFCEKVFTPKRSERKRFCSRDCAFQQQKKLGSTKPDFQKKIKVESLPHSKVFFQNCAHCGATFASKGKALRCKAHAEVYVTRRVGARPCVGCGEEITGNKSKLLCHPCKRSAARERSRVKHGRVGKHRHRARKYGVAYEPISPTKLFERDQWRCQICGSRAPQRLRGTYHDRAPEVDHRIPMSKGGGHTWDNVQCACRKCNVLKGNTSPIGQLPLFIN